MLLPFRFVLNFHYLSSRSTSNRTQSDRISLSSVAFAQKQDVQVKFRSGIKLALHKKELDEYTQRLRQSTEILSKIQGSTTMVHSMTNKSFFGRSHKLVKSLRRVQSHANRLHKAISSVWRSDCHAVHETKLLIEDRIEDSRSRGMRLGKNTMSVQFDVVFGFSTGGSTGYLLQGVVEIIPQDCQEHSGAMKSDNNAVKVKFSPPQGQHMISNSSSKVQDICSELQKAGRSQKPLFLQLQDPNVLYMKECEKHTQSLYTNPSTSVTLHELLESSTQLRNVLSIRASLRLALALASGVLQLHMTPWFCNNFWSKEGIYFLKSSVHDIDITRPMTSCAFKASPVTAAFDSEPRHVLLELGITFLELWRGVTIEQKFAGRESQLKGDYFDRLHLAWRWLEESQDHLLDYQSQAVEFCMKPIFLNQNAKVRWDDDDFLASLTANVIEPLHRAIKPRPSHAT